MEAGMYWDSIRDTDLYHARQDVREQQKRRAKEEERIKGELAEKKARERFGSGLPIRSSGNCWVQIECPDGSFLKLHYSPEQDWFTFLGSDMGGSYNDTQFCCHYFVINDILELYDKMMEYKSK